MAAFGLLGGAPAGAQEAWTDPDAWASPAPAAPASPGPGVAPRVAPARVAFVAQAGRESTAREIERFRARVRKDPRDRRARYSLARALRRAARWYDLLAEARDWQRFDPANPTVYEHMAEALLRLGKRARGMRALTAVAEVTPRDPLMTLRAATLLLREGESGMAEALLREALIMRPEFHNTYRMLALTLWVGGRHEEAAAVLVDALGREYEARYQDVKDRMREELAAVLRAWRVGEPAREAEILALAKAHAVDLEARDAVRVTLQWETHATIVDLHLVDPTGDLCTWNRKQVASGARMYQDLIEGLGPTVIVVPEGRLLPGEYHVGAHYYRAGPMGISRGEVLIQRDSPSDEPDLEILPFTLLSEDAGASTTQTWVGSFGGAASR